MSPFRFIHAADLHLDSPLRARLAMPEAMRAIVRESTFRALDTMVDLALSESVDFVLLCGDVYDAHDRSLRAQFRFKRALEKLADYGVAVYVIHGNHDPLSGYRANLDWPQLVHFFPAHDVSVLPAYRQDGEHVADIYGISYDRPAVSADLSLSYPLIAQRHAGNDDGAGRYKIAMLHTNVDGQPGHDDYAPSKLRHLIASGFDYWALGHIHKREILHEHPWVVYPGNTQGRNIREAGEKGVYIVDVSADGTAKLTFQGVDVVRWEQVDLDFSHLAAEQELIALLRETLISLAQKHDAVARVESERDTGVASKVHRIVRIQLHGSGPLVDVLEKEEHVNALLAELREIVAAEWQENEEACFIWPESIHVQAKMMWDRDALGSEESFFGDLLQLVDRMEADSEKRRAFVSEALAPLTSSPALTKLLSGLNDVERGRWLREAEHLAMRLLLEGGRRN